MVGYGICESAHLDELGKLCDVGWFLFIPESIVDDQHLRYNSSQLVSLGTSQV